MLGRGRASPRRGRGALLRNRGELEEEELDDDDELGERRLGEGGVGGRGASRVRRTVAVKAVWVVLL